MVKFFLTFSLFLFSIQLFSQQTDVVDFLKIEASIGPDTVEKKIEGRFLATFEVLKEADSIFMDAVNIKINDVQTKNFKITSEGKKVWFVGNFEKGKIYKADFWYSMIPKQTLYFFGDEIWTQGQGKYTSHWLPSIDDVNDKIEFDLMFLIPKDKSVVANGKLIDLQNVHEVNAWRFDMEKPMSSY